MKTAQLIKTTKRENPTPGWELKTKKLYKAVRRTPAARTFSIKAR